MILGPLGNFNRFKLSPCFIKRYPNDNWGYIKFKNATEVTNEYIKYAKELKKLVKTGFSAAVYTQTTDVEGEVNGFMTYDRKVDKMDFEKVSAINKEVIDALNHQSN